MTHSISRNAVAGLLIMMLAASSPAQVTNYWTQQYGTRSNLLGGSVIGSVTDMSATYYNPGAVALFKEASLLLSAQVYEYAALKLEEGADEGRPLKTSSIRPAPDLLAGTLRFSWLGNHKLAYSILTRERSEVEIQARGSERDPASQVLTGEELLYSSNLKETWAGLAWSLPLGKNLGIGVSSYLAIRDQKRRSQVLSEDLTPAGEIGTSILINHFEYQNYRLVWKAGLGWNLSPLTLGFTITAPSVRLFGSGGALFNYTVAGLDVDGDGTLENILAANYQDQLESRYQTSWALGGGGSYQIGKTKVHFSGEWFDAIDKFAVLNTKDFISQSSGDTLSNQLTLELQSVFNYGIGIEHALRQRFTLFGSFSTDFSGTVPGTKTNLSTTTLDVYNLAAGAAFTVARWELTLGGAYAYGREKFAKALNIDVIDPDNPISESLNNAYLSYRRIKLLFGFSYQL